MIQTPDEEPVAAPARSRYSMGSTSNLVRSLLVMLALVAVLWFLVPRPSDLGGPKVDVHAVAVDVAKRSGFPIVEAVGLPAGWTDASARFVRGSDGLMTWHAGYRLPDGTFAAVEQTKGATAAWVEAQTNRAPTGAEVTAGGRTWVSMVRDNKVQNSLLDLAADPTGVTTLVTGTASLDQLAQFAAYLRPVTP